MMRTESVNRLSELLQSMPSVLKGIREEDFAYKPNPDKWSKKEILGHLIDSALNNHQRFIRVQYEDVPSIRYEQNEWCERNGYQELTSEHILNLWILLNKQILEVIKRIPEENRWKKADTGLAEPVTLEFLIDDYVAHMEHHLKQISNYE